MYIEHFFRCGSEYLRRDESVKYFYLFVTGVAFCMLSLFCACIMAFFDSRAAKILKKAKAETGKALGAVLLSIGN